MTSALFLAEFGDVAPEALITITGAEAHHAVAVKRIEVGESVLVADGRGSAVSAVVESTGRRELTVRVVEVLRPEQPGLTWGVVQALAKGDRGELAVQTATELGARRILAWQAARSIVRWQGERRDKSLEKWRATSREATKQARRFQVPEVSFATTADVAESIARSDIALLLHEDAGQHIADIDLPAEGAGLLIVGPEGGIAPDELDRFIQAGARAVTISDAVLRTSTAAAVALGQLDVLARRT